MIDENDGLLRRLDKGRRYNPDLCQEAAAAIRRLTVEPPPQADLTGHYQWRRYTRSLEEENKRLRGALTRISTPGALVRRQHIVNIAKAALAGARAVL